MPKSSKKEDKKQEKEVNEKVHQDLVVRNMPKQHKFKSPKKSSRSKLQPQFHSQTDAKPKSNFKVIGFFIIFAGVIFIGFLLYLGYNYIIKPGADINREVTPVSTEAEPTDIKQAIPVEPEDTTPAVTDITTTTSPVVLDPTITEPVLEEEDPIEEVISLPPLLDSDNDGLNDEEETVLGTNPLLADTDDDGYEDLSELNNGYDPNGSGLLTDNSNITNYINDTVGYEIIRPASWGLSLLNSGYTVIFTAPDESLIQVSVQDNSEIQSILSWYEKSFPDTTVTYSQLKNNDNWDGVIGPNGFNFYLTGKDRENIYVISYISAVDDRLTYPNIFNLIIDSLQIK